MTPKPTTNREICECVCHTDRVENSKSGHSIEDCFDNCYKDRDISADKPQTTEEKLDGEIIKQFGFPLSKYLDDDILIFLMKEIDILLSLQATQIREKTVEECFIAFKKELARISASKETDANVILYELNEFISDNFSIMLKNK